MRYDRETTLLACSAAELRLAVPVPFCDLPDDRLLLYGEDVSVFWFEFDPRRDTELFLQHARFGCMDCGRLLVSREDLLGVAALQTVGIRPPALVLSLESKPMPPLRFEVDCGALTEAGRAGEWIGRVSICSCGIAGCFSQYGWFRDGTCLSLFTISGASLVSVDWRPFRLELQG
jgi:hypothetical protein